MSNKVQSMKVGDVRISNDLWGVFVPGSVAVEIIGETAIHMTGSTGVTLWISDGKVLKAVLEFGRALATLEELGFVLKP